MAEENADKFWDVRTKNWGLRDNVPWEILEGNEHENVRYVDDKNLEPQGVSVRYEVLVGEMNEAVEINGIEF